MRNPMNLKSAVGIAAAVIAVVLCCAAIAADLSADSKPAAVDAAQYADFMANEALDIQDLAEGAEIQRRMFSRITPPGISWLQPMFPPVVPFDAERFDDHFLDGLLGDDKNSVAIYPLSLALNPKTRETLVYNADGKLIATIPADKAIRYWPEDADPARVTLQLDLLPSEDVEQYLYTESRVDEFTKTLAAKSKKSGGIALRSLGASEFGFADMRSLTNGAMRLTVSNGTDAAEIYSYTVLHTSATVVVTYTNEQSNVVTDTNTVWYPVSPPYNGIESAWESRTTNLLLTNGVGTWEDANVASNARVRFYATAMRADSDSDGLTDGAEIFLYRTDPGLADTDGDGHSDGREIALGTDPLDGGDYFGIVINAALPIPPPPGSEVGREWIELFNVGPSAKSLAGFRLQTALPSGWTNVFTFPAGTLLDPGDFMVIGNGTNGDFQANLYMPNSSFTPPGVFGIRLVKPSPTFFVADALFYGYTNQYNFSLDGFGEELPVLRPRTNWVIRRTWIGYDTDHAGDWKNVSAASWIPHTQGDYLDLDGDGLSNAEELAGGVFPMEGGTRIDETDSDFDGVSDADELANGTDPNNVDTDGDAFPWDESVPPRGNDADELANGTDPLNADTDSDGVPDGWELASPGSGGQRSTGGVLDPLTPDTDNDAMPDGDEDTDVDGIPNAVEVGNLTNPFDADDVDPRPYLWEGQEPPCDFDEGDIGYGTTLTYHIQARSNCPPIMVRVIEGGSVIERFRVSCTASYRWLNPDEAPYTNRVYCITPNGRTNFLFKVIDGLTTWENEAPESYGADIFLHTAPALLDLDAGVPEESEETVGFLLADKSAHPDAEKRSLSILGPENTWGYASNIVLTYDTTRLQLYDEDDNDISSGTQFYEGDYIPALKAEGIAHSDSMRDAWIKIAATGITLTDRVTVTVLKADIGAAAPLADRTLHPEARVPLSLEQTLPASWNGLMQLSLDSAVAFWTPTGGVPIALGETVFTNAQLPKTIYLEGDGCGTNMGVFSVVGLPDCKTNVALKIFGLNATLDCVSETNEYSPGGFIANRTVHTNAPRSLLTLNACGPTSATGNVILAWNSSMIRIYTVPTGGTALVQFSKPYNGFTTTNLYVEGIAPGSNTLAWSYSEQTNCVDFIRVTVIEVEFQRDGNCSGFDDTLNPPWIMAPVNDTNTALAAITPSNAANNISFLSIDTGRATVSPSSASASPQLISLVGVAHGDTAIRSELACPYSVCASLNVAAKRRIDKTIAIHAITEENDDAQIIPVGQGQPNQICVTAGTNGVLNSFTNGDDVVTGSTITTGPNGICETASSGDDVQVIAVGKGKANAVGVAPGANNFRDTPTASGDDAINGDDINTGADGICNTAATASNLAPIDVPTAAALEYHLNNVAWGRQANIYFTVTRQDHIINYDLDRNSLLNDPYQFPSGIYKVPEDWAEIDQITLTAKDSGADYNVYYVKGYEYPVALTVSSRDEAWVGDQKSGTVAYITAHEVGHLLGVPGSHAGRITHMDLMGPYDSPGSPCRIRKIDWDDVNP